jgi:uncharacterized protein YecT (DUF1311 family)
MALVLSVLLLAGAAPSAAVDPNASSCENPTPDDARPYTLCLAETDFERAELKLNRQWRITLARVTANGGIAAERKLRTEQQKWLRARNRECEALAADSPLTQAGRNQMSCLAKLTEERVSQLKRMARLK